MATKISAKPRLQPGVIIDRAMEMADAEGLEAVTIRRLAQELGVTPMALYWHFADKDALLHAISARLWEAAAEVLGDVGALGSSGDDWGDLRRITTALVSSLRRHPGCASLAGHAVLACPAGLDLTERALAIMSAQGLGAEQAATMAHFLLDTTMALVVDRPGGDVDLGNLEEKLRAKRVALATLSPERYPHVIETAPYLVECDTEKYFAAGIDFVLGGLRNSVEHRA